MLQISVDVTVLSRSQREAIADFILSFPTAEDEGSTLSSVTFPEISEENQ